MEEHSGPAEPIPAQKEISHIPTRPRFHPIARVVIFSLCAVFLGITGSLPGIVVLLRKDPGALERIATGQFLTLTEHLVLIGQFVGILVAVALCCWFVDGRSIRSLGLTQSPSLTVQVCLGFLFAIFQIAATLGLIVIIGGGLSARWVGANSVVEIVVMIPFFTLQAGTEELADRGYVLQTLLTRYSIPTSVALSSCLFSFAHGLNPGFFSSRATALLALTNLCLYGVFASVSFLRFGTLWFAIAGHAGWNWILGSVLGAKVSGVRLSSSLLLLDVSGPSWLTGEDFGLEASPACTVSILFSIVLLLMIRGKPEKMWWQNARR